MKKAYIFVYSNNLGTRESIKNTIDSMKEIIDWRYDLPNSFYLISEKSATDLANQIRAILGDKRFIITEISSNKQGWLQPTTWHFINKKERKEDDQMKEKKKI